MTASTDEHRDLDVPTWWLVALTALALVLRLINLNSGLWIDEIYSLLHSFRPSLWQIVSVFPRDNHHPFYSVLAHLSLTVFGESPWSIRLPAALFGAATIPLLYLLGTLVVSRREALLAAALLCVSYHHVWFSQNARGYALLAFFAVAGAWVLLRGLEDGRPRFFVAYAVLIALGAWTHLTMVFVAVGHALACAIAFARHRDAHPLAVWRRAAFGFVLSGVLTILLYAPVLTDVTHFFTKSPSHLKGISTPRWAVAEAVRGLLQALGGAGVALALVALLAAALLFGAGLWSFWRTRRLALGLFILPGVVTITGALAARGTMYPRFFFALAGYGVLIAVRGAFSVAKAVAERTGSRESAASRGQRIGAAVTLALIVLSALSLTRVYRYPKQDFEGARRFVESHRGPHDTTATVDVTTVPYRDYDGLAWPAVANAAELQHLRIGHRVWLVYTFPRYLQAAAPDVYAVTERECRTATAFKGTVGGGDVYVCALEPTP